MNRLVNILLLLCISVMSFAVVATPDPVLRQLPDGSWAKVYIRGDEFYHYLETLDGIKIAGSEVCNSHLAEVAQAKRAPQETLLSTSMPSKGRVYVPVVLVNFTDLSFTMDDPVGKFTDFYNGSGGSHPYATGSVREYYLAASDSILELVFDVYGPYTLKREMAYYGANKSNSHMQNTNDLVNEAAQLACDAGVDMSKYDNDNDGYIDNLSIVAAGYNEAEGGDENTIWPHYSMVTRSDTYSGKQVSGYLVISEYSSSGGKVQAGIGTYCHEFGHALGLPDLYHTSNAEKYTVGSWDVMCSGNYNNRGCTPPSYSAFERFMMGWLIPTQLEDVGSYRLEPLLKSNTAYLIASEKHNLSQMSPSPSEYFMIENRQAVGWDAKDEALIGTGMLVSHITFNASSWNRNTFNNGSILGYAIVGAYDSNPTKSTAGDLYPGTGNVKSCLPVLNDGTRLLNQKVQSIRVMSDGAMSFYYGPESKDGVFFSRDSIETLVTTYDNRQVVEYDIVSVEASAKYMENDSLLIYMTNNNFEFSLDSGSTWVLRKDTAIKLIPDDSVYTFAVYVRHSATRQNCQIRQGYLTIESQRSHKLAQMELRGYSPRPIYIQAPAMLPADNISTTSFTVNWKAEEDAEFYYVTLFTLKDEPEVIRQSFDAFRTKDEIADSGWAANFIRTTSQLAESKQSVLFLRSGEQLMSEEYILPPRQIRFWLSNNYVSNSDASIGGTLVLEGKRCSGIWMEIDRMRVLQTTKNLVKEYQLEASDSLVQFRWTYTHKGGDGGVAMDEYRAHMDKTVQYIYRGTDREVYATTTSTLFTNLLPNTPYYYGVQAYEDKGCSANYSPMSMLQETRTLSEGDVRRELIVTYSEDGGYEVILPEPADGMSDLYIYSAQGKVLCVIDIAYASKRIKLPDLPRASVYLLLQSSGSTSKNRATGKWIKTL